MRIPKPVVLLILDGYGISPIPEGNAVWNANTPNLELLQKRYPKTLLHNSGNEVGLPYGEFGNSEVGHLNIGSGRIIYQPLLRVFNEIASSNLDKSDALSGMKKHLKENKSNLHLAGLISAGGVHSHIEQLFEILNWCKRNKIENVFLHLFTDGRDSPPRSAADFINDLQEKINEIGVGAKIASVSGRYYAMDRDNRWGRTQKAYNAMIGKSGKKKTDFNNALEEIYEEGKSDEFVQPTIITDKKNNPIGKISDGDALFFFNIRPDRSKQILNAFAKDNFKNFASKKFKKLFITTLTEYDDLKNVSTVFPEKPITNTLTEVISKHGKKQLHIAETEKYAHVTYFFSGGVEKPFVGEKRILIPSPRVTTYDKKPEMSVYKVTEKILEELDRGKYDFYAVNFANPDMVGHTGKMDATIKALEAIDECVGKIYSKIMDLGGALVITSDHGNAESLVNHESGEPDTEHNIFPSPFILVMKDLEKQKESPSYKKVIFEPNGVLADIAPTVLELMHIKQPSEMTGISLLDSLR